jgi:hypothetical protein
MMESIDLIDQLVFLRISPTEAVAEGYLNTWKNLSRMYEKEEFSIYLHGGSERKTRLLRFRPSRRYRLGTFPDYRYCSHSEACRVRFLKEVKEKRRGFIGLFVSINYSQYKNDWYPGLRLERKICRSYRSIRLEEEKPTFEVLNKYF